MALDTLGILLIVVYALACIVIGVWSSRKQGHDEYLIAGRKLGTASFIMTVIAGYIGGGALVAYTAYVYQYGISAILIYTGAAIGFLAFIWYALRIRKVGHEKDFHTLSDWFRYKYGKKIGITSAVIIFLVYFGFLVNQLIAGSSILSSISGWPYGLALLFSSGVIVIYLLLGGFKSVVKTDAFQYLVVLTLFLVLGFSMLGEKNVAPELLDFTNLPLSLSIAALVYGICTVFMGADYWQRVYAAKNSKVVVRGLIGSAIFIVITGLALALIGLSAASTNPDLDPSQAAAYGFSNLLPTQLTGFGLILLFAAIMSSADTFIFLLATSVAKDYLGHEFYESLDKKRLIKITRTFIGLFAVFGAIFAFFFRNILAVILTISGLGFALIPSLVWSFHGKAKKNAVFASLISGMIYVFTLVLLGLIEVPELAIASVLVALVVLLIGQVVCKE